MATHFGLGEPLGIDEAMEANSPTVSQLCIHGTGRTFCGQFPGAGSQHKGKNNMERLRLWQGATSRDVQTTQGKTQPPNMTTSRPSKNQLNPLKDPTR